MNSMDLVIDAYKAGIDTSLLRENLKLTVEQRFEKAMALQQFAEELRQAGKAQRYTEPCERCGWRAARL